MAIPSVGINDGNVIDPGVVNIETQAYPLAVDPAQALVRNLAALVPGFLFAPPPVPPDNQAGPLFALVGPANQVFVLPSLALGTPLANVPSVDVGVQNVIRQPIQEFIVTESGNFQVNANVPQKVSVVITAVQTITQTNNGVTTTFFVLQFGPTVNLCDFGVDCTGTEATFPNSAPANNPNNPPAAPVTYMTNRQITVDGTDLTIAPVVGNTVILDFTRHGPEVITDLFPNDVDVTIAPAPPLAVTTVAADARPLVNAFANDGVVSPFIGAGTRIPLLLYLDLRETAFFPADRPITTLGLPVNVNIG